MTIDVASRRPTRQTAAAQRAEQEIQGPPEALDDAATRFERSQTRAERAPQYGSAVPAGAFRVGGVQDWSAATGGMRRLGAVPVSVQRGAEPTEQSRHSPALRAQTLAAIRLPDRGALPADWQRRATFIDWHFNATGAESFKDIAADLDAAQDRGIRSIMMYAPYHGDPNAWLGGVPIDLYATTPRAGSMQEFETVVKEAHKRGIAVSMYMGPENVHPDARIFKQAVADKAAGKETHATRAFIWAKNEREKRDLGVEMSGWAYSKEAKAWYATSWERPAFNLASQDGLDEVANGIEHWAKKGVDGFYFDAPNTWVGRSKENMKYLLGDLPRAYGAKFVFPEGQPPWALGDEYRKYGVNFGIFGDDNDDRSLVEEVMDGKKPVEKLEAALQTYRDPAARSGGGTGRPLVFHQDEQKHLFSGAVLAGNGVQLDVFHSIQPGELENYADWSPSRRAKIDRLMSTIANDPAQAPGGERQQLKTGKDPQHFAVKRTSLDGRQHALNIYNFKSAPSWVTVDLTGSGIQPGQTPRDAYSGQEAERITGNQYRVKLPAHGFLLLDVQATAQ